VRPDWGLHVFVIAPTRSNHGGELTVVVKERVHKRSRLYVIYRGAATKYKRIVLTDRAYREWPGRHESTEEASLYLREE
jgi:hypothetical protein